MRHKIERLTRAQLRTLLDCLYDGEPQVAWYLYRVECQFIRSHHIFMWLAKNNIKGKKILEFFKNQNDNSGGESILRGVTYILNQIDGLQKHFLENLKADELI